MRSLLSLRRIKNTIYHLKATYGMVAVNRYYSEVLQDFLKNYLTADCAQLDRLVRDNLTDSAAGAGLVCHRWDSGPTDCSLIYSCTRENSLLFLLLMLGTLWLATTLYNFNQTPYLQVWFVSHM